ncbi:unnamed protein product [Paramecium sonneborni]|uniref:Uncharacterized protein n=1 Tax=Paramecium sonneborni TaxID=65129 RepID=A0A8S1R7T7_9CILI|nr:unnamed protein product [Paramecium sonneborni]
MEEQQQEQKEKKRRDKKRIKCQKDRIVESQLIMNRMKFQIIK